MKWQVLNAAACQEQTTGIGQAGKVVASIDKTSQQNATLVEQMAAARKAMEEQAQAGLIAFFRVGAGGESRSNACYGAKAQKVSCPTIVFGPSIPMMGSSRILKGR